MHGNPLCLELDVSTSRSVEAFVDGQGSLLPTVAARRLLPLLSGPWTPEVQGGQLGEPTVVQGTSGGATSPAARRFVFRALLFTVR